MAGNDCAVTGNLIHGSEDAGRIVGILRANAVDELSYRTPARSRPVVAPPATHLLLTH